MATALIIGASRGIGRELARQYLAEGWRVLATARGAEQCAALTAVGAHAYRLDVTNAESIAALGWSLDGEQLDVAFLVAGVYGPRRDGFPTEAEFDEVMHTNVLAALRLLPPVAPIVAAARGKLAVLSSRMGSIGGRTANGASLYRASKAALNSVLKDASIVYGPQGATCVAFNPGWVRTDMGGAGANVPVEQSVSGLRKTLAGLTAADNGSFLNYDGTPIPW
ncbi:MAG: short chain dehydrogenase [Massilia sp.]|nr:short chain dehydrogenase [Massilia sp.]